MALRIKSNIDLKELEKYGFEICKWDENQYRKEICSGRRGQNFDLIVFKKGYYGEDRTIYGYAEGADGDGEEAPIDDTLYDLIKADLVEKVGE